MRSTPVYVISAIGGVVLGLGAFTFHYGEGLSYFSTKPEACVNCHVMREQYDGWQKSPHHATATCVDCHLPHEPLPKLIAKAKNGWFHSKAFTLQDFHEPIMITEANARILQKNCVHCHASLVGMVAHAAGESIEETSCVRCHADVGHGPTR